METSILSNKMMISFDDKKLSDLSQNHLRFYTKYSSFVLRALRKPTFQKFLGWMLKKEKIDEEAVRVVYVKVLPARKKNGQGIAGKCDLTRGRIGIYPKTIRFCQMFKQKFGRRTLSVYAGNRARAALIHELLHLKYAENEKTVRDLSKEYFYIFTRKQSAEDSHITSIYTMIFNAKSDKGTFLQTPQTFADQAKAKSSMFKSVKLVDSLSRKARFNKLESKPECIRRVPTIGTSVSTTFGEPLNLL